MQKVQLIGIARLLSAHYNRIVSRLCEYALGFDGININMIQLLRNKNDGKNPTIQYSDMN